MNKNNNTMVCLNLYKMHIHINDLFTILMGLHIYI